MNVSDLESGVGGCCRNGRLGASPHVKGHYTAAPATEQTSSILLPMALCSVALWPSGSIAL